MSRHSGILILAGSTRAASLNRRVAQRAFAAALALGLEATLIDLRDYVLPLYDGDFEHREGAPANVARLRTQLKQHPIWLIASPDYNSSISPLVKNAIDWVSRPVGDEHYVTCFKDKVVGLMSSSPGNSGGSRGLPHLRHVLTHLGATAVETQLLVPKGHEAFDAAGALHDAEKQRELERFIRGIAAMDSAVASASDRC